MRLNSTIQNEVRNLKKLSRITIPCFIVQLDFQIGNSARLHKAKYACFSPTKKLLVLGWKIKFLRGGQFLFNWRYPLKDTWISEPVFRFKKDERTDTMFKLATFLALATAYLLMFAWIEAVSAEGATVSLSYI